MGTVTKNEKYDLGSGDVKLDLTIGNAHAGDTRVKLNNQTLIIAVAPGNVKDLTIGNVSEIENKKVYIRSNIDKISNPSNAVITVKLEDESNEKEYRYSEPFGSEKVITFEIYIHL